MQVERAEPVRTEVNGIPLWWLDAPVPYTVALAFRVGRADETLATSGLTHLVEHLALFPMGQRSHPFNGSVDHSKTTFWASGSREDVVSFFEALSSNLHSLPFERLETERSILLTEQRGSRAGTHSDLWSKRFGAVGYGLMDVAQLGLRAISSEEVEAWAAGSFTSGNAVLFATGPPPDDLRIDLPTGRRVPPVQPIAAPGLAMPGHYVRGEDAVALSWLAPRSVAAQVGTAVLGRRAHARLRLEMGTSYTVGGVWEPLTAGTAYAWLSADGAKEHGTPIAVAISQIVDDLVSDGPTDEELTQARGEWSRMFSEPIAAPAIAEAAALNELLGAPFPSRGEVRDDFEGLTPPAVRDTWKSLVESALLALPAGAEIPAGRFQEPALGTTTQGVSGEPMRRWDRGPTQTVLAPDGVAQVGKDGRVSVAWQHCVGVLVSNWGVHDMLDASGWSVSVSPWYFVEGQDFLDAVQEHVGSRAIFSNDEPWRSLWAATDIANIDRSAHWKDLVDVLSVLDADERAAMVVEARHAGKSGLLVVTDHRLAFVAQGRPSHKRTVWWTADKVKEVRSERGIAFGGKLIVGVKKGGAIKGGRAAAQFEGIKPNARLQEVADQVRRLGGRI